MSRGSDWPHASGEMAGLIRARDWRATPLGTIDGWPQGLKSAVEQMLGASQIASLVIGPQRIFLYNDAAARHYGTRHPAALGVPLGEAFPHEVHRVAPFYDRVFAGESIHIPAQPLDPSNEGRTELFDAYLKPVRGADGAVIAACMTGSAAHDRHKVDAALRASEERQAFLLELSDALRPLNDPAQVQEVALRMLGERLGADRVAYSEMIGDEHVVQRDFTRGVPSIVGRYPRSVIGRAIEEAYCRTGTYWENDVARSSKLGDGERAAFASLGIAAYLGATLCKPGHPAAAFALHQARPRAWKESEVALIREVADRIWTAVEHARAEMALRESESKYRHLFETMRQGYAEQQIIRDQEGLPVGIRLLEANPQYGRLTGIPAEEASGQPIGQPFPDLQPSSLEAIDRIVRSGRPERFEQEAVGLGRWFEVHLYPRDDDRFVALYDDITERKRVETALRTSEERLRQFGEASQDILWIRDAETLNWTYLTPAFEAVYGVRRDEALAGDNYRNWLRLVVPEDRARANENIRRVCAGEHVTFDYRIRRPIDGAIRWLRNTDFPIVDDAGKVVLIGGIGHDMTGLRETEQRLQALMTGIPQLVWRALGTGDWTWASPQWTEFTGQSEEESRGEGWLEPVHPDDRPRVREIWGHAIQRGRFEAEYRIRHAREHRYRWFQTRATPVRDSKGRVVEWLGTSTDVDEQRRLQERQQLLVAELQHRVRNILTVVRSVFERTMEAGGDVEDLADHYRGRLDSLARTQVVVTQSASGLVDLENLIRDELLSVGVSDGPHVIIDGPDVALTPKMAESIGLAIHELTTNSLKYGALKVSGARLEILWTANLDYGEPQKLNLTWNEQGVPAVSIKPSHRGFGSELITEALPYRLGAETSLDFRGGGVRCTLSVPLSDVGAAALPVWKDD